MHARTIVAIARKDFLDAVRNARLLVIILMPIGFSLLYGFIFASSGDITQVTIVVYDPGHSQLVEDLAQPENIHIVRVASPGEIEEVMRAETAIGGLVIPADYDGALREGRQPALRVLVNGSLGGRARTLPRMVEGTLRAMLGHDPPARIEIRALNPRPEPEREFDFQRFMLIIWLMMTLTMIGVMIPPTLLVEEKEKKTLATLLVTPASYADVVAAKAIIGFIYVALVALVILAMNQGLRSDIPLTVLVISLSSLFVVELGLCMGALFNSVMSLNTWNFVVMLPLMMPGILVPVISAGVFRLGAVEMVIRLIPTYYTARAMQEVFDGTATPGSIAGDVVVLLAGIAITFAAAIVLLRRRES